MSKIEKQKFRTTSFILDSETEIALEDIMQHERIFNASQAIRKAIKHYRSVNVPGHKHSKK